MKKKEFKSKTCKGRLKIDYSFNFLRKWNNLNNNSNINNPKLNNSFNTVNNMAYSESKKHIKNKKEYKNNIIKISPPYDTNLKSFFGVY